MKKLLMLMAMVATGAAAGDAKIDKIGTYNGGGAGFIAQTQSITPGDFSIWSSGTAPSGTTTILTITNNGRTFWKGHEIDSDDEFRAAMLDVRKLLLRERIKVECQTNSSLD